MKTEQENLEGIFSHSIQPKVEKLYRGIQKRIRIFYGIILAIYLIIVGLLLPEEEYINVIHVCGAIPIILIGFIETKVHSFKKLMKSFKDGKYVGFTFMTDLAGISTIFAMILLLPVTLLGFEDNLFLSIIFGLMAVISFLLPLFNLAIIGNQIEYGTEKIRIIINTDERKYFDIKHIEYLIFKGEDKDVLLKQKLKKELEDCDTYAKSLKDYSHSYGILAGGDTNG